MPLPNVRVVFEDSALSVQDNVVRYELRDAIGDLTEAVIEIHLTDPELDLSQVVGKAALLQLMDQPVLTQFDGLVRRCRQLTSEATGVSRYEIYIVPPLWLTTLRTDHRIFQNLSVPDIVEAVLRGYGDRIAMPNKSLMKEHPKREYTVQYGETDYDFICRILAEEGIGHFFEPAEQGVSPATNWVLSDDSTLGASKITAPFVPPSGQNFGQPHILAVEVTADVTTSLVTVRDYDYKKPELILQRTATTSDPLFQDEGNLEGYVFDVGKFKREKEGDARATQLLEEARSERRVLRLSSSFGANAGAHLTVTGLPGHAMETDLVVVRSRSVALITLAKDSKVTVSYLLECVPTAHPFRPRRRPKPRIYGTHTAIVVGQQAGVDEIDVDDMGRVKVEFRWDRRDAHEGELTRRIRVSQGWAGAGFGFVLLPRVNEEVIIAYIDGDPDEPIIVGRVHNSFVTTPLKLPDEKTQSIWKSRSSPGDGSGFNMIRMEDKAGEEFLNMRAQKDHDFQILHDATRSVGHNETVSVKGSQSVTAGSHSTSAGTISFSAKTTLTEHAGTKLSMDAGAQIFAKAPLVLARGTAITSIHGDAMLYLYGGVVADLGAGTAVDIHAGSSVSVNAPTVFVGDSGTVWVSGGEIHIGTGDIKIIGSKVAISGGTVDISGGTINVKGGTINLNC